MGESSKKTGTGPPAKDEVELLEILRLLIKSKKARTTSDLLKYAAQYGAPEAEERLRMLEAESVPLDLAFDAISVQLRLMAHKRNSALLAQCRGQKVGLILPLPPDLAELFVPVAEVSFLLPEEGALHGPMHELAESAIKGPRACRAKAQEMQTLVFEAFREGGTLFVDVAAADVLEPKMLPAGIRLIAHLRPHRNPHDIAIQPSSEVSFI
ncbi:MAG TPA: hypothetical protein VM940_08330 [Chthoniobacterales bacterium]|jgi:hypothetical protein|nr:hypothetical protein [Chthoniobacterales bacterium]